MTETQMYQTILKRWFDEHGFFHKRIEQDLIPDTIVIRNGVFSFCELKVINTFSKKTKLIKPDWRVGQLAWISEYNKYGGDAWLILYCNKQVFFLRPQKTYTREELVCQRKDFLTQSK